MVATLKSAPVSVRLLGPFGIDRAAVEQQLPASRKVRALCAYLALAQKSGVSRSLLCDLLWDRPNDPRGELRWALSKLRGFIDEPECRRLHARADMVRLDLSDCFVDALEVERCIAGLDSCAPEEVRRLAALFGGEFLAGLEVESSSQFHSWLIAQRQRFHTYRVRLLERLLQHAIGDEVLDILQTWREIDPLDERVHERLLHELNRRHRIQDGYDHLASTIRVFEAEGLDGAPVRQLWENAKDSALPRRAALAVLPFANRSSTTAGRSDLADALVHDIITKLAKLRVFSVIAQGTVFALRDRGLASHDTGALLDVDYIASGSIDAGETRLSVSVEVSDVRTRQIVWTDDFECAIAGTFDVLDEIADSIVAALASEIEASERNRAILRPPNSLDAWQAHHRGLWHMYRFTKPDNDRAQQFFEMVTRGDPTFARAWAGLSFAHFQNAFQGWEDRSAEIDKALLAARQSLMADDRDPAAHWAMGRALWLSGEQNDSFAELGTAVELSPNFALGHYTLAFVHAQAGDPEAAIAYSDRSRRLSPYDPLLFGMLGSRAMALARIGRTEDAAHYALQAAARPNAHAHILAIAALCLATAKRIDEGRGYVARIRAAIPAYCAEDFLTAMRFEPEAEQLFRVAARSLGL